MNFTDVTKACIDCGQDFTDRAKDQEFRFKKGWVDNNGNVTPMKRCYKCRQAKKAAKTTEGGDNNAGKHKPRGYR